LDIYDGFKGWTWDCNRTNPCECWGGGQVAPIYCDGHIKDIKLNYFYPLTGSIASSIGDLSELSGFNAAEMGISGTIPAEMIKLKKLTSLNLISNSLEGVVPALPFSQYTDGCTLAVQSGKGFDCPLPPGASTCNTPGPPGPLNCTPTPAPTPGPVMYSCNAATGNCAEDPHGTQSPGECIATCKCVTPHNCGQHNNTIACNNPVTGCNVCAVCCKPWLTVQASCDGCFEAPVPNGCGGKPKPS
jgi:hypothetical protein